MTTMYRTDRYAIDIQAREVVKATGATVTFAQVELGKRVERRENRVADCHHWHDTWEDAHAHLLACARSEMEHAQRSLTRATQKLALAESMKNPNA